MIVTGDKHAPCSYTRLQLSSEHASNMVHQHESLILLEIVSVKDHRTAPCMVVHCASGLNNRKVFQHNVIVHQDPDSHHCAPWMKIGMVWGISIGRRQRLFWLRRYSASLPLVPHAPITAHHQNGGWSCSRRETRKGVRKVQTYIPRRTYPATSSGPDFQKNVVCA